MAREKCPHAFRKCGDVSLHCKMLASEQFSHCAHQYFCRETRRWEASPQVSECPLRQEENKRSEKNGV